MPHEKLEELKSITDLDNLSEGDDIKDILDYIHNNPDKVGL